MTDNIVGKTIKEILRIEFGEKINKDQLLHFERSIIKIINSETYKLSYLRLEKEDFISHVYLALKEVKEKFSTEREISLITYANYIIKKRILDYARYLRRDKRKITLQVINTYRSGVTEEGITFLERDFEKHSFQLNKDQEFSQTLRETIEHFKENHAVGKEIRIVEMLSEGYSQKEIIEVLGIKRKDFVICKEKLKKLFNYFNKDISKI